MKSPLTIPVKVLPIAGQFLENNDLNTPEGTRLRVDATQVKCARVLKSYNHITNAMVTKL